MGKATKDKQNMRQISQVLEATLLKKKLEEHPVVTRLPPKLRLYRARKVPRIAHKLAKATAKRLKKSCPDDAWKEAVRELNKTLHYAKLHDFDLTVESLLSLKTSQMRKRNQAHLSAQIQVVTNLYSPSQLARQASHAENGSGKGGMTQGHEPA